MPWPQKSRHAARTSYLSRPRQAENRPPPPGPAPSATHGAPAPRGPRRPARRPTRSMTCRFSPRGRRQGKTHPEQRGQRRSQKIARIPICGLSETSPSPSPFVIRPADPFASSRPESDRSAPPGFAIATLGAPTLLARGPFWAASGRRRAGLDDPADRVPWTRRLPGPPKTPEGGEFPHGRHAVVALAAVHFGAAGPGFVARPRAHPAWPAGKIGSCCSSARFSSWAR